MFVQIHEAVRGFVAQYRFLAECNEPEA